MMGPRQQRDGKLFYTGFNLDTRLRPDHPLRAIRQTIDFSFVRPLVKERYGRRGHPSIDPIVLLKLMFLLFYEQVPSERALMAQLPERLDWLWFCGYDLDDAIPDHSVLSKARRRWGVKLFETFFARVLEQCVEAGLVEGRIVHVDSSVVSAPADKSKLQVALNLVGQQLYETLDQAVESSAVSVPSPDGVQEPGASSPSKLGRLVSPTDPEAGRTKKHGQTLLGYKDHRAVDDAHGIITATVTTAASTADGQLLSSVLDAHAQHIGQDPQVVVADKIYGTTENYKALRQRQVLPCIPHPFHGHRKDKLSTAAFTYDPQKDSYVCPEGNVLKRTDRRPHLGRCCRYQAPAHVCDACPLRSLCTDNLAGRLVHRHVNQDDVDWADRAFGPELRKALMRRRTIRAEGSFADAANRHGFKKARWRGLVKMTIQNLLIAALQNLRKLLKTMRPLGPVPALPIRFLPFAENISAKAFVFWPRKLAVTAPFLDFFAYKGDLRKLHP
jgi:IS5 family transposase